MTRTRGNVDGVAVDGAEVSGAVGRVEQDQGMHEQLLDALLAPDPVPRLRALRPQLDGPLAVLADTAVARLELHVPDAGSAEAILLRTVAGRPGLSLAELQDVTHLPDVRTTAAVLLASGLVSDRRFQRADCWSRTTRGVQALRRLGPG